MKEDKDQKKDEEARDIEAIRREIQGFELGNVAPSNSQALEGLLDDLTVFRRQVIDTMARLPK